MKLLFAINHPAQYHFLKNPYQNLKKKGHDIVFVIKDKDILEELMISEQISFYRLTKKKIGHNRFSILVNGFFGLVIQDINLFRYVNKFKPDLMLGTDISITHIGKLFNIPSIVFNEDDYEINKLFCRLAYPLSNCIVSPTICNVGNYQLKKINYNGYQKLSYLHPSIFKPDPGIVAKYISPKETFFIIRLVSFSAGHDIEMNHSGLGSLNIRDLINTLLPFGKVFISSETRLPVSLEQFKLKIDYKDIHHLLAFSTLFIADSQSMIVEAAVLGTPSIRFNSFVGKISVLEELEKKYGLTVGIHNSNPVKLMNQVKEMITNKNLKSEYKEKREKMLFDKINVNLFLIWFIENYPQSIEIIKKDPNYQYNFQ
jgi:predicted glycosyltransferase